MRFLAAILLLVMAACSGGSGAVKTQIDPDTTGGILVVGNKGEDSVSFIDLASGEEIARRPTAGRSPHEVALSPDGKQVAVVHYGGSGIELFDVAAQKSIGTIKLPDGARPHGIEWLDDGRIVASAEGLDAIAVIRRCGPDEDCLQPGYTHSVISTAQEGSHMVVVSRNKTRAYTSNLQSRTVTVIDLEAGRKITDLKAADQPEGLDLTPDGKELWVASRGSDKVHVYDTASLKEVAVIDVGDFPIRLAITPDGKYAVTSDYRDGGLTVIDVATRKVARKISVSGSAASRQITILFNSDGSRLYAAEAGPDMVAEIDFASGKVLRRFKTGNDGDGLAIAPAGK